jgi:hypothetical protein
MQRASAAAAGSCCARTRTLYPEKQTCARLFLIMMTDGVLDEGRALLFQHTLQGAAELK